MSQKQSMFMANFTCRFGEKKGMLDMFDNVVLPAFLHSEPRVYGKNTFYLFDTELIAGRGSEPVITGRFVRNHGLSRSHILREKELVPNYGEMESATGARFALILSTHTLIYVPETPYAPNVKMFQSTMQSHLLKFWSAFVKEQVRARKNGKKRHPQSNEFLAQVMAEYPQPELKIIELPSRISIQNFLANFRIISRVEFLVEDTNHSPHFLPLMDALRDQKQATKSKSLIIVEKKPENLLALTSQLHDAGRDGNVTTKITGKGHQGEVINGSPENFRLTVPMDEIPKEASDFVNLSLKHFKELVTKNEISVTRASGVLATKIRQILAACRPSH